MQLDIYYWYIIMLQQYQYNDMVFMWISCV